MNVGRNDPCPCGSGLKYKKCCLPIRSSSSHTPMRVPPEVLNRFACQVAAEEKRQQKYGQVRPVVSADFKGYKFVAVGNALHYDKKWRTFPDFLFSYIKHAFGSGWGQNELTKDLAHRHTVMQWYDHLCRVQKDQVPNEDGLYAVVPDAITSAYLLLAYYLYILRHHGKLQSEVLRRLRRPDQFRGARYELFVAATFIRAGFEINYEDETDSTRKHPEFVAKHAPSQLLMSVEAKARHRDLDAATVDEVRPGVKGLLSDAAEKQTSNPFAVFVELALPPQSISRPTWIEAVQGELNDVTAGLGGHAPFDLVMFTNLPHQYGQPHRPDPTRHFYAMWPHESRIPEEVINALGDAAQQYGNVPNTFPGDFD